MQFFTVEYFKLIISERADENKISVLIESTTKCSDLISYKEVFKMQTENA